MTPVVWAAIGLVAGLIVMWLILRLTVLKRSQEQAQSASARAAELESARAKEREEAGKLESRLQYREHDNAELKERLSRVEGQLRERQQAAAALETQATGLESARSDLERALARLEDRARERELRFQEVEAAAMATDGRLRQSQSELADLRGRVAQRDQELAALQAAAAERDRQLSEAEEILDRQRATLRSSSGADKGLRAAVNRQQAEINVLRQKLEEALVQVASRNQRLALLQQTLSERKSIIADLRRQLHDLTRGAGVGQSTESDDLPALEELQDELIAAETDAPPSAGVDLAEWNAAAEQPDDLAAEAVAMVDDLEEPADET